MRNHNFFERGRNRRSNKKMRDTFLIVCEGERTEPNYFKKFPLKKEVIEVDVIGEGKNTNTLVLEAMRLKRKAEKEGNPYNQVWVVFDRDSFPAANFQKAIQLCDANGIRFAVTNEAFELWYLLHFHYYDSGISRTQYGDMLTALMGRKYIKNQKDIYELLKDKQDQAIKWSKKLQKYHFEINGYHDYCNSNPISTVYELVEELNEYIED